MKLFWLIVLILIWSGCSSPNPKESTPTTGIISILCEEGLRSIIEQEEDLFERNYPNANVEIQYLPSNQIFNNFINDTSEIIIASRMLSDEEKNYLGKSKNLHPREFPFAVSAVAFVTSLQSKDTTITYEDVMHSLKAESQTQKIFVIENTQSGIPEYLMTKAAINKLPSNFYAQNSLKDVTEYIKTHIGSVGIIDWTSIADSDDPYSKKILSEIRLIKVLPPSNSKFKKFVEPYQYNLQDDQYPFTKTLYCISRSAKSDLGLGFASFITGEIGQKIILKAGLLPIYQTDRWVEIKSGNDPKVIQ